MKTTKAYIERTFNLGNYESLKIGFEAELNETDKPLEVTRDLENLILQHFENRKTGQGQAAASPHVTATPAPSAAQTPPLTLPPEIDELVTQELCSNGVATFHVLKTKRYLKQDTEFPQVMDYVKSKGGKYVAANGQEHSHWRIPA